MFTDVKLWIDDRLDCWRVVRCEREHKQKSMACALGGFSVGVFVLVAGSLSGFASRHLAPLVGSGNASTLWFVLVMLVTIVTFWIVLLCTPRKLSRREFGEIKKRLSDPQGPTTSPDNAALRRVCPWCGYECEGLDLESVDPPLSRCSECGDLVMRMDEVRSIAAAQLSALVLKLEYEAPLRWRQRYGVVLLVLFGVDLVFVASRSFQVLPRFGITGYHFIALSLMTISTGQYYFEQRGRAGLREKRAKVIRDALSGAVRDPPVEGQAVSNPRQR